MAGAFVDTNILLYAAGNAPTERPKALIARRLLISQDLALSTQVLQEFYWVATRSHKLGLTHREALAFIDVWKLFPLQPINLTTVEEALELCQEFQISYWDAAILAAARQLACDTLYSEDFAHGRDYKGIRALNPFAEL